MSDTSNLHTEGGSGPLQLFYTFRLFPDTTDSRTIYWNNRAGGAHMVNDQIQYNSPAFILLSEFGKAYYHIIEQYKIPNFYGITSEEGLTFNTMKIGKSIREVRASLKELENKVARNIEFPAANILNKAGFNEGYRTEWGGGTFYEAEDVNCTEPKDDNAKQRVMKWSEKITF